MSRQLTSIDQKCMSDHFTFCRRVIYRANAIDSFKIQMIPLLFCFTLFTMYFAKQPYKFFLSILVQYPIIIVLHRITSSITFQQRFDKWTILFIHTIRICINEGFLVFSTVLGGPAAPGRFLFITIIVDLFSSMDLQYIPNRILCSYI